ncbi:dTDP-glucose 4,6-dehydratase [Candidatus Uhrbacteria bacterium]|nr:dTDP-glucose 4,6-dehydratase [Candidatus Uhrbacteria bacterium]
MKLLVTGGAGFMGSNFIHYWLAHHPEDCIVNLDALTYAGNLENLMGLDQARYQFIQGNICDAKVVHQAMEGIDMVVHFAAETHVDRSINHSLVFIMTNAVGTQTLLEEVRKRGTQIKRFHHISTDEVFGSLALNDEKKFNEQTPYDPRSPYSASKAASDHLCRSYYHTHGLPITISNSSNNYGSPYHFPEKFIPLLIIRALHDEPLPIYGDGKHVRDWIHVEDHCRGVEAILERGRSGETYCLGGNSERANLEVAKTILQTLGKPESLIQFVEDRKGHDLRYAVDFSKAKQELGWEPRHSFEDGIKQTIEWYKSHAEWWKPLLEKAKL